MAVEAEQPRLEAADPVPKLSSAAWRRSRLDPAVRPPLSYQLAGGEQAAALPARLEAGAEAGIALAPRLARAVRLRARPASARAAGC